MPCSHVTDTVSASGSEGRETKVGMDVGGELDEEVSFRIGLGEERRRRRMGGVGLEGGREGCNSEGRCVLCGFSFLFFLFLVCVFMHLCMCASVYMCACVCVSLCIVRA